MYKVIRFYFTRPGRHTTVATGLTLEEAQEHCKNPETSSLTCKLPANVRRTRTHGQWFDGYEET